jgi:hypothetical protein
LTRTHRDEPVGYRRLEHRRRPPVADLHLRGGKFVAEALHEPLNLASPNRAKWPVAEPRVDVPAVVGFDLVGGAGPVDLDGPPQLGVRPERGAPGRRVYVRARQLRRFHNRQMTLGIDLAQKRLR